MLQRVCVSVLMCCAFMIGSAVVSLAAGSAVLMNDLGDLAAGIIVEFDQEVTISAYGDVAWVSSPTEAASRFTFSGFPIEEWGMFWIRWSPSDAVLLNYTWLSQEDLEQMGAEPAVACTDFHTGPWTVRGHSLIEAETYCEQGIISVAGTGLLEVKGSRIHFGRMMQVTEGSSPRLMTEGRARLSIENSEITSDEMIEITFDEESVVDLRSVSLDWFHAHHSASIRALHCSINNFHLHDEASAQMEGCTIGTVVLNLDQKTLHVVESLSPGFHEDWNLREELPEAGVDYQIWIVNSDIESWSVSTNYRGARITVRDCELRAISGGGFAELLVERTRVERLDLSEMHGGTVVFDDVSVQRLHLEASYVSVLGSVRFDTSEPEWSSSHVVRTFPFVVTSLDSSSSGDVRLKNESGAVVWNGTVDPNGRGEFVISFDDENYQEVWQFEVAGYTESVPVTLMTETPIRIERVP